MWADEQRMAVFRCKSRSLVWDLGVDLWWKLRDIDADQLAGVFVMFFWWFLAGVLKFFFGSAKFPNAEAFWCGLSNHVRSDFFFYLGSVFFSQRLWVTNLWCLAYLQLQHTRHGSFGTIQTPMRLSSWSTPTHPNKRSHFLPDEWMPWTVPFFLRSRRNLKWQFMVRILDPTQLYGGLQ